MQQLVTEAVILSVAGGVLGMAFAHLSIRLITGLIPEYSIPHEVVITLNTPVLLFSTAVSVAIGILAGLSPALQFSSPHISQMIQSARSRSTTSHGARTRSALIVGQTALTVLMLAGAGAAMRNFLQAYAAELGFDSHQILTLRINLPERSFPGWQERATKIRLPTPPVKPIGSSWGSLRSRRSGGSPKETGLYCRLKRTFPPWESPKRSSILKSRYSELNSKWIERLNTARGWILGAGMVAIGTAWLAHH